jgi:hypothetical protein
MGPQLSRCVHIAGQAAGDRSEERGAVRELELDDRGPNGPAGQRQSVRPTRTPAA